MGNGMRMEWVLSFAVKFENQAAVDKRSVLQKPLRASTRRSKNTGKLQKIRNTANTERKSRKVPVHHIRNSTRQFWKTNRHIFFLRISVLRSYFLQWVCVRGFFSIKNPFFENIIIWVTVGCIQEPVPCKFYGHLAADSKNNTKNPKKKKQPQNNNTHTRTGHAVTKIRRRITKQKARGRAWEDNGILRKFITQT